MPDAPADPSDQPVPATSETLGRPEPPAPSALRPDAPGPDAPRPDAPRPDAPRPDAPGSEIPDLGVSRPAGGNGQPASAYSAPHWPAPAPWPPTAYPGQPVAGYPGPWTGAGPPPPPGFVHPGLGAPPPRRSRTGLIVSIVAVVVVLACLGFGTTAFFVVRHVAADPVVDAPVPTDYPTDHLPTDDPTDGSLPDAEPTHDGDIKQYLIGRPATAHTWPKVKAAEALDLAGAAANFSNSAEGKLVLQRYGFKDGYTRRWIDDRGDYIIVRVLRFADAGDGDNFANFYIDSNQASGWGEPDDVPGVPEAAGFVKPKREKNGVQRSLAVGDSGDIVAIVIADQLPPARASTPDALLANEFHLL